VAVLGLPWEYTSADVRALLEAAAEADGSAPSDAGVEHVEVAYRDDGKSEVGVLVYSVFLWVLLHGFLLVLVGLVADAGVEMWSWLTGMMARARWVYCRLCFRGAFVAVTVRQQRRAQTAGGFGGLSHQVSRASSSTSMFVERLSEPPVVCSQNTFLLPPL
jgi:uncharacterized membrane protein YgcG